EYTMTDNVESIRSCEGLSMEVLQKGHKNWQLVDLNDVAEIFIMNDDGKTIERFIPKELSDENRKPTSMCL
ncbi:hypothetical protein LCGC14_2806770, partial [marine sediment metagenome]